MIQMKKQEVQNFPTVPLYMYVAYMKNYMLKVSKILQLRKRFFLNHLLMLEEGTNKISLVELTLQEEAAD